MKPCRLDDLPDDKNVVFCWSKTETTLFVTCHKEVVGEKK